MQAMADFEHQKIDLQFGPNVVWSESIDMTWIVPNPVVAPEGPRPEPGVRAMYARLARAYEAEPMVPDHGGGVPGDRFPL